MKQLIFIILLSPLCLFGQLTASLDTNSILIGDQITFTLEGMVSDKDEWPSFNDSIGSLELLSSSAIDSSETADGWLLKQSFIITQWDSGFYHIPSFTIGNAKSQQLIVTVNTVSLDEEVKDIKGPIEAPITLAEAVKEGIPYFLALILTGLIAMLVLRYLKNKPEEIVVPKVTAIPPYEIALSALEQLKVAKLWQEGDIKGYYSSLSEIIRTYIEDGLQIPAMEMPTDDIVAILEAQHINTDTLSRLLSTADMAKFAKAQPLGAENEQHLRNAFDFIHQTKPPLTDE